MVDRLVALESQLEGLRAAGQEAAARAVEIEISHVRAESLAGVLVQLRAVRGAMESGEGYDACARMLTSAIGAIERIRGDGGGRPSDYRGLPFLVDAEAVAAVLRRSRAWFYANRRRLEAERGFPTQVLPGLWSTERIVAWIAEQVPGRQRAEQMDKTEEAATRRSAVLAARAAAIANEPSRRQQKQRRGPDRRGFLAEGEEL